jgi:hypothetical protein
MMARVTAAQRNEAILRFGRKPNRADRYMSMAMDGHVFDEGEIVRGMKMMLNDWSRDRSSTSKAAQYPELGDSIGELITYLWEHPRPITAAHSAKGIAWWRKNCFCVGGTGRVWRENQFTANLGALEREVIDGFTHFEFCGYEERTANSYGLSTWLPCYRVHGLSGYNRAPRAFDYIYGAWQSGTAGLEIV